jgi:putative transposase
VTSLSWAAVEHADGRFCVATLSEALTWFGEHSIFNTDQGAQFTSDEFTKMLQDHGIEISMDGQDRRECCHGNIFVERLWWTMKHEWVCLCPAANGIEQKRILAENQPEPRLHHALPGAVSLGRASRVWRSCVAISSVALM